MEKSIDNNKKGVTLRFITPATVDELHQYDEDILFFHNFLPYRLTEDTMWAILEHSVPRFTLIYAGKLPIGCFFLDVHNKTAELHGIARPDLKVFFGKRGAATIHARVYHIIFSRVFNDLGKQKVITKVPLESKGGLGFVRLQGFKKLSNLDKGRTVWKLERGDWLARHGEKEEAKRG